MAIFDELPEEQLNARTPIAQRAAAASSRSTSSEASLDAARELLSIGSSDVDESARPAGSRDLPRGTQAALLARRGRFGEAPSTPARRGRRRSRTCHPRPSKQGLVVGRRSGARRSATREREDELLAHGRGASRRGCGRRSSKRRRSAFGARMTDDAAGLQVRGGAASASTTSRSGSRSRCSSTAS